MQDFVDSAKINCVYSNECGFLQYADIFVKKKMAKAQSDLHRKISPRSLLKWRRYLKIITVNCEMSRVVQNQNKLQDICTSDTGSVFVQGSKLLVYRGLDASAPSTRKHEIKIATRYFNAQVE